MVINNIRQFYCLNDLVFWSMNNNRKIKITWYIKQKLNSGWKKKLLRDHDQYMLWQCSYMYHSLSTNNGDCKNGWLFGKKCLEICKVVLVFFPQFAIKRKPNIFEKWCKKKFRYYCVRGGNPISSEILKGSSNVIELSPLKQ